MVRQIEKCSAEEVRRALEDVLRPLFEPEETTCIVLAAPKSLLGEISSGFENLGVHFSALDAERLIVETSR